MVKKIMKNIQENFSRDKSRILTSIFILIVLAIVFLVNNFYLAWILLGILFGLGVFESTKMYEINLKLIHIAFFIAIWLIASIPSKAISGGLFMLCLSSVFVFYRPLNGDNDFKILFPFIYPTLPFLALLQIYSTSMLYLAWLILIVTISDIGAYYVGKAIGKTQLCSISPKKTLEGAIGGVLIAAIIGGIIGIGIFSNFYLSFLITALISIVSIIGDLFESYLKRRVNMKDSGNVLPGHGGILDRLDALLFAGIAFSLII